MLRVTNGQGYSQSKDGTWTRTIEWITADDLARFTAERDKMMSTPTTGQMLEYAAHWTQRNHPRGPIVLGHESDRCSVCGMSYSAHPWHDMEKALRAICTGERVKV